MSKKIGIVLGNGFTIDFLNHVTSKNIKIWDSVDVANLFKYGDVLKWPGDDRPGFLSYKNTPNLWNIGARPYLNVEKTLEILERVVTSANVYSLKNKEMIDEKAGNGFLSAYKELVYYLKYLFVNYNSKINDITEVVDGWSWANFFKSLNDNTDIEEVVIITYNYDIWLERILTNLDIKFELPLFCNVEGAKFKIFKPHGSISFQHKVELPIESFEINYRSFVSDCALSDIKVVYNHLEKHTALNFLIPPAGESGRTPMNWTQSLRGEALAKIKGFSVSDIILICGISYWHVDRREIDDILVNINSNVDVVNVNPNTNASLEAVLNSLFSNYMHFNASETLKELIK